MESNVYVEVNLPVLKEYNHCLGVQMEHWGMQQIPKELHPIIKGKPTKDN